MTRERRGPWPTSPLEDLVEILDHRRIPVSAKERASRTGDVPYYGATGQVGVIDKALFDEPLILLGEDGVQFFDPSKPKAYRITGPAWVNNHAHVLRARPEVADDRFLMHYLNQFPYQGYANGTTRLKLTQAAMRRIPVTLPSVEEQRRIVDILEDHLSRLEAGDHAVEATAWRLVGLRRSALHAVTRRNAKGEVKLADLVLRIEAGKSFGSSSRPAADNEWGIIKVSAMTWGEFRPWENKAVVDESRVDPKHELRPGDLLVSRANTTEYVGAPVLVRETRPRLLLSDKSLRLVPRPGVSSEYLLLVLSAPSAREQMSQLATGTKDSMRNISQGALLSIRVPGADSERQALAVAEADAITTACSELTACATGVATRSAALRRSLLSAAFSGRLSSPEHFVDEVVELARV